MKVEYKGRVDSMLLFVLTEGDIRKYMYFYSFYTKEI